MLQCNVGLGPTCVGAMGWVRAHIRSAALLALFALALQTALSFGHFHGISTTNAGVGQVVSATASSAPDNDRHSDGAADICAVCAVMAMAGTMLAATPPALPALLADALHHRLIDVAFAERTFRGVFQPRGPPYA